MKIILIGIIIFLIIILGIYFGIVKKCNNKAETTFHWGTFSCESDSGQKPINILLTQELTQKPKDKFKISDEEIQDNCKNTCNDGYKSIDTSQGCKTAYNYFLENGMDLTKPSLDPKVYDYFHFVSNLQETGRYILIIYEDGNMEKMNAGNMDTYNQIKSIFNTKEEKDNRFINTISHEKYEKIEEVPPFYMEGLTWNHGVFPSYLESREGEGGNFFFHQAISYLTDGTINFTPPPDPKVYRDFDFYKMNHPKKDIYILIYYTSGAVEKMYIGDMPTYYKLYELFPKDSLDDSYFNDESVEYDSIRHVPDCYMEGITKIGGRFPSYKPDEYYSDYFSNAVKYLRDGTIICGEETPYQKFESGHTNRTTDDKKFCNIDNLTYTNGCFKSNTENRIYYNESETTIPYINSNHKCLCEIIGS